MSDQSEHHALSDQLSEPLSAPMIVRSAVGGVLMGLANLVPGISGGTMLLAAGVYPDFVDAIARLSTLRIHVRPLVILGTIALSAALAILLLAGTMKSLVIEQRWVMYSLFIGLTLGGVPLVWRLAKPASRGTWVGAAIAFTLMVLMALGTHGGSQDASTVLLFFSGLAGASAMILPGVSGGYLLLLLGQYEPILGAIDSLKAGLLGSNGGGPQLDLVLSSMNVVVPVGRGVVVGIVGVSNLLKWLLTRFEAATLGALLGLLLGALVGLYPFQAPVEPSPGFVHGGHALAAEEIAELDPKHWPLARFRPSGVEAVESLGLIALGLGATLGIAHFGRKEEESADPLA